MQITPLQRMSQEDGEPPQAQAGSVFEKMPESVVSAAGQGHDNVAPEAQASGWEQVVRPDTAHDTTFDLG